MSIETYIFTKKEKIPTSAKLQKAIKKAGFDYRLAEGFDTSSEAFGFWMGSFEGLESGCDYAVKAYDEEEWEFDEKRKAIVGDADSVITLSTLSNVQEIVAMASIASVLSQKTGGVMLSSFFSDELIAPGEAVEMAKNIIENSREQFNGPSSIREALLNRDQEASDEENRAFADDLTKFAQEMQENINDAFAQKIASGLSHSDGYEDGAGFASEVRASLEGAEIVLADEVDLAFCLFLGKEKHARKALKKMDRLGLKCRMEEENDSTLPWLCYGSKKMLATADTLESIGDTMLLLAKKYKGNFDGWETVPEYEFDPYSQELDAEQCLEMAKEVLANSRKIHTPPHKFIKAKHKKFVDFDLKKYGEQEEKLKALGFKRLADLENKTISDMGEIVTFSRVMYHKKSRTIGLFYYFDMWGIFFFEFASKLSDGTLVVTTNAIPGDENGIPDTVDARYMEPSTIKKLYKAHQSRVDSHLKKKKVSAKKLNSVKKFVAFENKVVKRVHKKLKSIGWVSKEFLLRQSGGDEELVECVYEALQRILEDED